ncbi:MAG TPA: magnesium/cobalt transporter CorA [Burkholderiales bacterium]|nr:magnesium/cobalt transporter CorA [Burkholderiales bacterium]
MNMVVNCAAYSKGRKIGDIEVEEISEILQQDAAFVWVGLHEPSEELMRKIQEEFNLHDLAVEDAHRAHQRPKVEAYGDSLFIVLHTAQKIEGKVRFGETHIFIGAKYVVSVRHGASLTYKPVRSRCESTPHLLRKGPAFVLYAIVDFVVDNYIPIVEELEDEVEQLEADIFKGQGGRATTERIYELKRDLMATRRAIWPLMEVCGSLMRFDVALIPEDSRPYFRDVHDHVIRINEAIDNMREALATALSVNVSLTAVGQNEVMKKLAGWAAILAVPTMVGGIYGMNFEYMPELHWKFGYPLVIACVLVVCALIYRRLKRAGWL